MEVGTHGKETQKLVFWGDFYYGPQLVLLITYPVFSTLPEDSKVSKLYFTAWFAARNIIVSKNLL